MNYKSTGMGTCPSVTRWTTTAIECYERGCNCKGCFYNDFFSKPKYGETKFVKKCNMKATVLELVRVLGTPDGVNEKTVIKDECN